MRLARKLMLLATMAVAAMALVAPGASAQTEPLAHHAVPDVIVRGEPGGVPCPAVTRNQATNIVTGGCAVHAGGPNEVFIGHVFGIESVQSTCNLEFDLRTDSDFEGYMVHHELTQGTQGTCTRRACGVGEATSPEGRPWEVSGRETGTVAPREILTVVLCVENLDHTNQTHCEFDIPMTETSPHRYSLVAPGPSPPGGLRGHGSTQPFCELVGTLSVESTQIGSAEGQVRTQVEVNHLPE